MILLSWYYYNTTLHNSLHSLMVSLLSTLNKFYPLFWWLRFFLLNVTFQHVMIIHIMLVSGCLGYTPTLHQNFKYPEWLWMYPLKYWPCHQNFLRNIFELWSLKSDASAHAHIFRYPCNIITFRLGKLNKINFLTSAPLPQRLLRSSTCLLLSKDITYI